jgi:16S rRNA (cytosine1402-N4)-methyltransferase
MEDTKPKRRVRYKGTHPRKFSEKYKELNPEKYPDEIEKVKKGGKTPAGTHIPICMNEILEILKPQPGQIAIDATLGYGGHTLEILKRITPGGKLLGFDVDDQELPKTEKRIQAAGFNDDSFIACLSNYSNIPHHMRDNGVEKADIVLADLGVSSMQLDNPDRGFSFKLEGPLDLRLGVKSGKTAAEYLEKMSLAKLTRILAENSDEPHAEIIAKFIIKEQKKSPIKTTERLTAAIKEALATLPRRKQEEEGNTPIRRMFQALRIEINNEFENLEIFLENLPRMMKRGGKIAILTFHSGEDRRVKKSFQALHRIGVYLDVARDVIRPSTQETFQNPRATSAKLRWAIKA